MYKLAVSSGTFVARINNRDHKLIAEYGNRFIGDGIELMMYPEYYENKQEIISTLKSSDVTFLSLHAAKETGDFISDPDESSYYKALELLKTNIEFAQGLDIKTIVVHPYGIPLSDTHTQMVYERVIKLNEYARGLGVMVCFENCVSVNNNSLVHMEELSRLCPNIALTIDIRCSQFHAALKETMESFIWENNVKHVHVSDFGGNSNDWSALRPILHPGQGKIDWSYFFKAINSTDYSGVITLESPAAIKDGVDTAAINNDLLYLKKGLGLA